MSNKKTNFVAFSKEGRLITDVTGKQHFLTLSPKGEWHKHEQLKNFPDFKWIEFMPLRKGDNPENKICPMCIGDELVDNKVVQDEVKHADHLAYLALNNNRRNAFDDLIQDASEKTWDELSPVQKKIVTSSGQVQLTDEELGIV